MRDMVKEERTIGVYPPPQESSDPAGVTPHTVSGLKLARRQEQESIQSYLERAIEEKVGVYVERNLEKYGRAYKLLLEILPKWDRLEARIDSERRQPLTEKLVHDMSGRGRTVSGDLKSTFTSLALRWKKETINFSSMDRICMNDAYQSIIGLGPDAVPLILEALEQKPDWWFWALRAITRADPATKDMRGNLMATREAWLAWGREHGLLRDHSPSS